MALGSWFLKRKRIAIMNYESLTEEMEFVIKNTSSPNIQRETSDFYLAEDKSLMYTHSFGDYSVLLGDDWRFELIVDSATGLCIRIQCFLDELSVTCTDLKLPNYLPKNIFFKSTEKLSPAGGCHYTPFKNTVFWDSEKRLLCIGDPNSYGQAVEFTNKTIAVINRGKLMCVYLVLDSIASEMIF